MATTLKAIAATVYSHPSAPEGWQETLETQIVSINKTTSTVRLVGDVAAYYPTGTKFTLIRGWGIVRYRYHRHR